MSIDKDKFWGLIDSVNREVDPTDLDGIVRVTKEKLQQNSPQDIAQFLNIQHFYKDQADTSGVFAASCCLNTYMSHDGYLDFRMWLISQGKDVYMNALKNPDSLAARGTPKDTTRFEAYGYVASDTFEAKGIQKDVYAVSECNPLTDQQKQEMYAELEYFPHRVTADTAASHLPKLLKQYLKPGASMSFSYRPFNDCPSPTDRITGLERMMEATRLIEAKTGSRFKHAMGGAFIYPESTSNAYFSINMRKKADNKNHRYQVGFDANLQTTGKPMDAAGVRRFRQEVDTVLRLLESAELQPFSLIPEEMEQFNDFLHEREIQQDTQVQTGGPMT